MRTDGAPLAFATIRMKCGGCVLFHSDGIICVGGQRLYSAAEGITKKQLFEEEKYKFMFNWMKGFAEV